MQRLNIPLDRTSSTTRRDPRRVVYLWGIGILITTILSTWVIAYFLHSPSLLAKIPEDTVFSARFTPTKSSWEVYNRVFTHFPLINKRGIYLEDLQQTIRGEFALLVDKEGNRSIILRANEENLPRNLLDHQGITVTELKKDIFHLGASIPNFEENEYKHPLKSRLPSIISRNFATLHFNEPKADAYIELNGGRLEFRIPKTELTTFETIPETTILALGTGQDLQLGQQFESLLSNLLQTNAFENPLQEGKMLILTENARYFLADLGEQNLGEQEKHLLLRTIASLYQPRTRAFTLPDNSISEEIIADPSILSIEEIIRFGSPIATVNTPRDTYYLGETEGSLVLTNNEDLLNFWLDKDREGVEAACKANIAYIDLSHLIEIAQRQQQIYNEQSLSLLTDTFPAIGIQQGRFFTTIRACEK